MFLNFKIRVNFNEQSQFWPTLFFQKKKVTSRDKKCYRKHRNDLYRMQSFKNQWYVTLFYNINLIKSVNECHVSLIFKG